LPWVVLPPPWLFYGCLFVYESDFDFITLPAHLTTGSSIMPHKKTDVLNWFVENATRFKLCHTKSQ
jgi:argininosuccinate lyase